MKSYLLILLTLYSLTGIAQTPFPLYVPSNPDSIKVPVNVNGAARMVYNVDLTKYQSTTNSAWYLRNNLRWLEYNQNLVNNNSSDFVLGFIGDSKIEMGVIPQTFTNVLGGKVKIMGQGYTPFTPTYLVAQNSTTLNNLSTWAQKTIGTGGKNLALYSIVSTASSVPIGWTTTGFATNEWNFFTDIEIGYYGQAGGGSFEVYVDNVLKATVNTSLTTGVQKVTISGMGDVAHSFKITPLGANVELLYYNPYRTTANSIRGYLVHHIGHSGGMVRDYLNADTSLWNAQFRNLNLNLLSIYLGTNERANAVPVATFKSNMKAIVNRIKALNNKLDIVLWGQADEDPNGIFFHNTIATVKQYNDALRQIAVEDTVAFFDVDKLASDYSVSSKKPFLTDGLHEGAYAAFDEAVNFYNGLPIITGEVNVLEKIRKIAGVDIYNRGAGGSGISAPTATGAFKSITTTENTNIANMQISTVGGQVQLSAPHLPVKFLTTNQNMGYHWSFESMYGPTQGITWSTNNAITSVININQGFDNNGATNSRGHTINITGFINSPSSPNSDTVRGIFYNPALTALGGIRHRAFENVSGNVVLGSSSGKTGIGASTNLTQSAILDVNQNDGVNYKGALLPRLTTAQRDSIVRGVVSITVTSPGTGYTGTTTVSFSPSGAVATATYSGSTIGSITVNQPGNYVTTPTVTISGTGTGATATATLAPLPEGLEIYNLDTHTKQYWNGTVWKNQLTD